MVVVQEAQVFGVDAKELVFPRLDFSTQGLLEAQTLVFPIIGPLGGAARLVRPGAYSVLSSAEKWRGGREFS